MYYIYHIPKRKEWGCSKFLEKRVTNLGYKLSDVDNVIICKDINEAADLEKEKNLEYGYGWNSSRDYRLQVARAHKSNETQSKLKLNKSKIQGTILGNNNLKNGHMAKIQSLGGKVRVSSDSWKTTSAIGGHSQSQLIHTCPNCGKEGKSNAMFRHHFNNCKNKLN